MSHKNEEKLNPIQKQLQFSNRLLATFVPVLDGEYLPEPKYVQPSDVIDVEGVDL
jgi:hypothetical protein